jgi:NitT/TauT family transport system substrate-binding protein
LKPFKYFLLLVLMLILAGCAASAAPQPEAIPIRIAIPPYLSNAAIFIAIEEGYFAAEGLDIEIVGMESTSDSVAALVQGDLDVTAGSLNVGWLNAMAAGEAVMFVANKGVAAPGSCYNSMIVSPEVTDNGVVIPERLVGGQVRFREANFNELMYELALATIGLTPDAMTPLEAPQSAIPDILETGELALSAATEPIRSQALSTGQAVEWLRDSDIIPDFQYAFITFGPNLLEDNPEAGNRFMRAYLRGIRQYNEGLTERNIEIVAEVTGLEPDFLQEACWPMISDDLRVDVDDIIGFQEWAVERGYMDAVLPAEVFYEPSFVEQALQAEGEQ